MTHLYLACQDTKKRGWYPVGRLSDDKGRYRFVYTRGVRSLPDFLPFTGMPELEKEYVSDQLFPLFANRILNKKRPEYLEYLAWNNVAPGEDTPFRLLTLTSGVRETDGLEIFPHPVPDDHGCYKMDFFVRGIRYLPKLAQSEIQHIQAGDLLYLAHDMQNRHDRNALLLRTESVVNMGYVPRYLSNDFLQLLKANFDCVKVFVAKVNLEAPTQYRVLCTMTAPWPKSFAPCSGPDFQPLISAPNLADLKNLDVIVGDLR